jgi:NAD(P)H-dependent FMN reductase
MGATLGDYGTVRAQLVLRQVLASIACSVLPTPEVFIAQATAHFDSQGKLHNTHTRQAVKALIDELLAWTTQRKSV